MPGCGNGLCRGEAVRVGRSLSHSSRQQAGVLEPGSPFDQQVSVVLASWKKLSLGAPGSSHVSASQHPWEAAGEMMPLISEGRADPQSRTSTARRGGAS